jgi:hypothetical protein
MKKIFLKKLFLVSIIFTVQSHCAAQDNEETYQVPDNENGILYPAPQPLQNENEIFYAEPVPDQNDNFVTALRPPASPENAEGNTPLDAPPDCPDDVPFDKNLLFILAGGAVFIIRSAYSNKKIKSNRMVTFRKKFFCRVKVSHT